jgi:hypothetical protein
VEERALPVHSPTRAVDIPVGSQKCRKYFAEPLARQVRGPVELSLPTRRLRRVGDRIGEKIQTASLLAASAR